MRGPEANALNHLALDQDAAVPLGEVKLFVDPDRQLIGTLNLGVLLALLVSSCLLAVRLHRLLLAGGGGRGGSCWRLGLEGLEVNLRDLTERVEVLGEVGASQKNGAGARLRVECEERRRGGE